MTNYPTFARADDTIVNLLPDGVANFYLTDARPYERSMWIKAALGPLLGLPFRPYRGTYLALETASYHSYWYFRNPGIMGNYLPLREFQSPAPPASRATLDGVLFLGQPDSGDPGFADAYDRVLRQVADRWDDVYYKPHPAEGADVASLREKEAVFGFKSLKTERAAELVAADYMAVVGVASSVLFNVSMLGWNSSIFAVQDKSLLPVLLGRTLREIEEIIDAETEAHIQPI